MAEKSFHCAVVTPEKAVLETEATFVAMPAHDGEMGILHDRAPLLVRLDSGLLRVQHEEGETALFVDGGFAEMVDNRLTVLTEAAMPPEEIDRAAAEEALEAAQEMTAEDAVAWAARQRALRRARVQIKLSS